MPHPEDDRGRCAFGAGVPTLGAHKRRLFAIKRGETLMVAAGAGNDLKFFPPGQHIVAIDISPKMLVPIM